MRVEGSRSLGLRDLSGLGDLRVRVREFGLQGSGLGFRFRGLGFRAWVLRFRVWRYQKLLRPRCGRSPKP